MRSLKQALTSSQTGENGTPANTVLLENVRPHDIPIKEECKEIMQASLLCSFSLMLVCTVRSTLHKLFTTATQAWFWRKRLSRREKDTSMTRQNFENMPVLCEFFMLLDFYHRLNYLWGAKCEKTGTTKCDSQVVERRSSRACPQKKDKQGGSTHSLFHKGTKHKHETGKRSCKLRASLNQFCYAVPHMKECCGDTFQDHFTLNQQHSINALHHITKLFLLVQKPAVYGLKPNEINITAFVTTHKTMEMHNQSFASPFEQIPCHMSGEHPDDFCYEEVLHEK